MPRLCRILHDNNVFSQARQGRMNLFFFPLFDLFLPFFWSPLIFRVLSRIAALPFNIDNPEKEGMNDAFFRNSKTNELNYGEMHSF